MNTRRQVLGVMLAGAATATLLCAVESVATARPAASSSAVLHLTAVIRQERAIDVAPAGPSVGDEQVASGVLEDLSGRVRGDFGFTCTTVGTAATSALELCIGFGALPGGQVEVTGKSRSSDTSHLWAVTGGTGTYATSHGTVLVRDRSAAVSDLTLVLQ